MVYREEQLLIKSYVVKHLILLNGDDDPPQLCFFCLLGSVTCCPGPHSIPYPLHSASCCVIVHTQTRIIIQASILWTDTLHLSAGVKARLMLLYKTITFCFISCCSWLFADPPPLFPSRISYRLYSKIKIRWG